MSVLKLGAKGSQVRELQTALNRAGFSVAVDGQFGPGTQRAVVMFQTSRGLVPDGIVGPATQAELDKPTNNQLYNAFVTCLDAVEDLPEFKTLEAMLYG